MSPRSLSKIFSDFHSQHDRCVHTHLLSFNPEIFVPDMSRSLFLGLSDPVGKQSYDNRIWMMTYSYFSSFRPAIKLYTFSTPKRIDKVSLKVEMPSVLMPRHCCYDATNISHRRCAHHANAEQIETNFTRSSNRVFDNLDEANAQARSEACGLLSPQRTLTVFITLEQWFQTMVCSSKCIPYVGSRAPVKNIINESMFPDLFLQL